MEIFKVGCPSDRRDPFMISHEAFHSAAWKRTILGLIVTIPFSIFTGIAGNTFREQPLPLFPEYLVNHSINHIDVHAGAMSEFRGFLVDARPHPTYQKCYIPEAFNFPPDKFDFFYGMYFSHVSKEVPIFIYGRTYSRAFDEQLAHQLLLRGHKNVTVVPLYLSCS